MNKIIIIILSLYLAEVIRLTIIHIINYKDTIKNREELLKDDWDADDKKKKKLRRLYTTISIVTTIGITIIWPIFFITWIKPFIKNIIKGVSLDE